MSRAATEISKGKFRRRYKRWQQAVFRRDGRACPRCGDGGSLTAHHIVGVKEAPELAFVVDNGQTLCERCHTREELNRIRKY